MGRKRVIREKELLLAIDGSKGTISTISKSLGCSWHAVERAIKASEKATEAFNDELETSLDKIESKAYEKAEDGDGAMIRFILATKGKKRGYTYEAEQANDDAETDTEINISVTGGEPAPIGFVDDEQQESEQE